MPILYDRSRVTTDWRCPRSRYWQYEYNGRGVTSGTLHLELYMGTALHDALGAIATFTRDGLPINIDEIAGAAWTQIREAIIAQSDGEGEQETIEFANEQAALTEGLVRGVYKHVWPRLMAQYPRIIVIEEEMVYEHDGLTFMSKPDLILATADDEAVYVEWKSTSSKREDWVNSWNTAIQLHSTVRAVEATRGIKVSQVIVQGMYKGYITYNKQSSPFCYGYFKGGNPPFTANSTLYEYKAGYRRVPTWEMEGGVKAWVDAMPENVLAAQFPQTPPIFINDDLVEAFFRQRAARENEIAGFPPLVGYDEQASLDVVFPQRFDQCVPSFGKPCQFRLLCHGCVEDPLQAGFQPREAHHALEAEAHAAADGQE